METGKKAKPTKPLSNNTTVLILPGVSRAHQEGKKEIAEFIVLDISSLIFLPAKGYINLKTNLFSNIIIITLAGVFLINLKSKRLFRSP